jgi:hypothetical protein
MRETEMGNRGSKSLLDISKVKEQRVDGSYFINKILMKLRYTLMGGESCYQVKILSKQLKKNFSTLVKISKLNP